MMKTIIKVLGLLQSLFCSSFLHLPSVSAKYPLWLAAVFTLATSASASYATPGALGDPNIKYFGRWDFSNPSQYLAYWGGAYLKVNFTGTTAQINVGTTDTTNYYAQIDNGPWTTFANASGIVNLTPTPLESGTHTLSVAQGKDYSYKFCFQGLTFDPDATTSPPTVGSNLIEFIGDSITTGYTDTQADVSDYAWICSQKLDCEHTQITFPGIALSTGYGFNGGQPGMVIQYLKLQPSGDKNWHFSNYTPQIVVINIGQNDTYPTREPSSQFQTNYATLLTTVRSKFPNAQIFAMRTFSGNEATLILAAVNAQRDDGDTKLHYVDTTGWLLHSDTKDGTHPTDAGQMKVARLLQPILGMYLEDTPGL